MIIAFTVTMVVTQMQLISGTLDALWGGPRAILAADGARGLFEADFENKDEVLAAANQFNISLAEEGFTLLRNENNSLPLNRGARVSVFGNNSVDLLYGGSGSGAGEGAKNIFDSLTAVGIAYNPALRSFYNASASGPGRPNSPGFGSIIPGFPTGQTTWASYTAANIPASYATDFRDAAIVVITRIGGEGFDLPRTVSGLSYNTQTGVVSGVVSGARHRYPASTPNVSDTIDGHNTSSEAIIGGHYLQLCNNEIDLLLNVAEVFENVVLIINSNNVMELGFLDDISYWLDHRYGFNRPNSDIPRIERAIERMRSVMWIGSPGGYGIMALGRILVGDVNPSGRVVNVWARNFRHNPTYFNFGNNQANMGNAYIELERDGMRPLATRNYFIEYEEGIYLGYRYYETRAFTDGAEWWQNNVIFPFGFGLSYSEFSWTLGNVNLARPNEEGELVSIGALASTPITAEHYDAFITVDVIVSHVKGPSGKDVVQLYIKAPFYYQGTTAGIEKAHVVLIDFAKTGLLAAGQSETLTLSFSMYDIASYDFNDANGNGFIGWETEAGDYTIYISRHANSWQDGTALSADFTIPQLANTAIIGLGSTGFQFRYDPHTPDSSAIVNRFNDVSAGSPNANTTFLSRADWEGTWPTTPTIECRTVSAAFLNSLAALHDNISFNTFTERADIPSNPWYRTAAQMPTQASSALSSNNIEIMLEYLISADFNDSRWETFLNQMTVSQMANLVGLGTFGTDPILALGIPLVSHSDGPAGWVNFMEQGLQPRTYGTAFYVSQCVIGATFNRELAFEFGKMIGNEGLIGNERGDGLPYTGWYAPGANIHRSPFSGRNWEYFSEDPVLSGRMAAQIVLGAAEKGVIAFPKHFAMNDQETNRSSLGILVWASEQSMREIYLRAFEILVKEGMPRGIMSSYNRIGGTWAGGDHRLLNEVLRGEWGFRGTVITDFALPAYLHMNSNQMIRAGGDLQLFQELRSLSSNAASPTQVYALRAATKNILYTIVHSNAMENEIIGYRLPVWVVGLIWANIGLLLIFLGWGALAIALSYKKLKAKQDVTEKKSSNK